MPDTDKLQNRQRSRRAILSGVLLSLLLLLVVLAPPRILGWSGLGFGSLSEPAPTVAAVDEPVAMAVAKVRTPPLIEPLTFPAYAVWSDLETEGSALKTACGECDWSVSYGLGELDGMDNEALSRLEQAVGLGHSDSSSVHSSASTGARSSAGGAMGSGGGAAGSTGASSNAAAGESSTAQAMEDTSESATDDSPTTARAAKASTSASAREAGSSSDAGESSSDGAKSSPGGSSTPDLILSRAMPGNNEGVAGAASSAGALPPDVVQALVESPVGSETVHSAGEPEVMSAALDLEETPAAAGGDVVAQQETVPEPMSLLLVGVGISAGIVRQRRAAAR